MMNRKDIFKDNKLTTNKEVRKNTSYIIRSLVYKNSFLKIFIAISKMTDNKKWLTKIDIQTVSGS